MNTTNQNDFLQPNPMSMATPPKPSPEAVAAANIQKAMNDALDDLTELNENSAEWHSQVELRQALRLLDQLRAKAELCDRLAADASAVCEWSYNEDYSYFDGMCGAPWYFEHVSEDEVPSKTLRFCPSCGKQIKRVERTRAAGPAVAGGGREAP